MTVKTITKVAKLNHVGEGLHFDGEIMAVFGDFDDPGRTYTREEVQAAIHAIDAGAEEVVFDEHRSIETQSGGVHVAYEGGKRAAQLYSGHKYDTGDGLQELIEAVGQE